MMATIHDLQARRNEVRSALAEGRAHVLHVLRDPDRGIASTPVGDVLCWTDGLGEAEVSRILQACRVNWGQRIGSLSNDDAARILSLVREWFPEVWERWRSRYSGRQAA